MLAPAETVHVSEWRPFERLDDVVEAWQQLACRTIEPNVFYEPAFAGAAAPVLGRKTGAILVWLSPSRHRLIGLFPCRLTAHRYLIGPRVLMGWVHPYGPQGTPLIDREYVFPAISAFFDHIAADPTLPKLVLLPDFVENGPVAAAFDAVLARRKSCQATFGRYERALLQPGHARADYVVSALGRKRRKELRRQWRRLEEQGAITFTLTSDSENIAEALADFFALEARGWKGRAGSAAAQMPAICQFIERAVCGLAIQGQASIARLRHGNSTIAVGILLKSGNGAWFWKTAYDEAVARASPGVQMTVELTRTMLADPAIAWCDSCACAHHPMIDHIWRERRVLTDRLVALQPGLAFALAYLFERIRRAALAVAKRARVLIFRR